MCVHTHMGYPCVIGKGDGEDWIVVEKDGHIFRNQNYISCLREMSKRNLQKIKKNIYKVAYL